MVKKIGQRKFLVKYGGYSESDLDNMSPSEARKLIGDIERNIHPQGQTKKQHSLFGSIDQCNSFLNYFIEFTKSKFDDEEIKAKLDDIVRDFWQHELFE